MNENTKATETTTETTDAVVETAAAGEGTSTQTTESEKTFTQKEVNDLIEKRLARAQKKWDKQREDKKQAEQESEASEEVKKLHDTINAQKERIMKYEAKALISSKVNSDMVDAAIQLIDLKDLDIDSEDFKDEVAEKIDALIEKNPWLKLKTEENKGFIKAGAEKKTEKTEDAIMAEILKGLGYKGN